MYDQDADLLMTSRFTTFVVVGSESESPVIEMLSPAKFVARESATYSCPWQVYRNVQEGLTLSLVNGESECSSDGELVARESDTIHMIGFMNEFDFWYEDIVTNAAPSHYLAP